MVCVLRWWDDISCPSALGGRDIVASGWPSLPGDNCKLSTCWPVELDCRVWAKWPWAKCEQNGEQSPKVSLWLLYQCDKRKEIMFSLRVKWCIWAPTRSKDIFQIEELLCWPHLIVIMVDLAEVRRWVSLAFTEIEQESSVASRSNGVLSKTYF